jgi:selenocysteine lyase/cysteine desulfurase
MRALCTPLSGTNIRFQILFLSFFRLNVFNKVEIPGIVWRERHFLRVSVQYYNTLADINTLLECLRKELPQNK